MKGYLSIRETSYKWGISERRVNQYVAQGRIPGAEVSGVRVEINGELPTQEKLLKALLAVMREACINAARHADATAMYVVSEQTEAAVTLHITNDGRQPKGDITPRGGLVYLEKYITRSGGRMEIQSQPEFFADGYFAGWRRKTGTGGAGRTRVLVVDAALSSNQFKIIHDFENASECFPGVEIKGGVNYFLWDRDYNGKCHYYFHQSQDKKILERFDYLDSKNAGIVVRDP